MKFYICKECGNIFTALYEKEEVKGFEELIPGTTDAASEKHVPAVEIIGNKVIVKVGEVEHPMLENHYITCIILETEQGIQQKYLKPGEKPQAEFALTEGDKPVAAYEYCNLHGLWKAEIK